MIIPTGVELLYRPREPDDNSYIFKTWVHTYRLSPMVQGVPSEVYFPQQRKVIGALLDRATTTMACNHADPKHIYGYVCFDAPDVLHFLAVKRLYWRFGLGRGLMEEAGLRSGTIRCSHWTPLATDVNESQSAITLTYAPELQVPYARSTVEAGTHPQSRAHR